MLRISELKQYKLDLEADIAKLIQEFENKTDVKVDGLITISHQKQQETVEVKVEIYLEM